jgi:hypothetical protein
MIGMKKVLMLTGVLSLAGCGDFSARPTCIPSSCSDSGLECGQWSDDGCGNPIDCGSCPGSDTCRADGKCVDHCMASTCELMGKECGSWDDGCGYMLSCGTCDPGLTCGVNGHCVDSTIVQDDKVSACGGFEINGGGLFDAPLPYCAAEVLHWQYLAAEQTLKLADARVLLNCCGDHSFMVEEQGGVYLFTEIDAPEGGWGRCACMCVFDYVIEVQGVAEQLLPIKIVRDVTDWPEGSGDVWEGDLDLSLGSGSIVIDDTAEDMWCTEP